MHEQQKIEVILERCKSCKNTLQKQQLKEVASDQLIATYAHDRFCTLRCDDQSEPEYLISLNVH